MPLGAGVPTFETFNDASAFVQGLDRAEQKLLLSALMVEMRGEDKYEVLSKHNYYPEEEI